MGREVLKKSVWQTACTNCDIFNKYVGNRPELTVKMSLVINRVKIKRLKIQNKGDKGHYTFT